MPNPNNPTPDELQKRVQRLLDDVGDITTPPHQPISLREVDALLESVAPLIAAHTQEAKVTPPTNLTEKTQEIPTAAVVQTTAEPIAVEEPIAEEAAPPPTKQNVPQLILPEEITEPSPAPPTVRTDLFGGTPVDLKPMTTPSFSKPIEKSGFILQHVKAQMTTDLSPLPKIVPVETIRQTQTGLTMPIANSEIVMEGQQRFADFEEPPPIEQITEEELQEQAEASRLQRSREFETLRKLSEQMAEQGETRQPAQDKPLQSSPPQPKAGMPAMEYTRRAEAPTVFCQLLQHRFVQMRNTLLLVAACGLSGVLLGVELLSSAKNSTASFLIIDIAQIILLFGAAILSAPVLYEGFSGLFKRTPNAESALSVAFLPVLAQTILSVFPAKTGAATQSFVTLFLAVLCLQNGARWLQARNAANHFRFVMKKGKNPLYAMRFVQQSIKGDLSAGGVRKTICYPAPVHIPEGFVKQSFQPDAVDDMSRWMLPVTSAAAGLTGLCAGLLNQSLTVGMSIFAAALCLGVPCVNLIALHHMLRAQNKDDEDMVMLLSSKVAEDCANISGIALDSDDLFVRNCGRNHGLKEYKKIKLQDVALYASAIAIAAGGPLQAVFEGVVLGDHSQLPPVESLQYEDRMGLSCYIHRQKVFLGNRSLLENHNIRVSHLLSEADERKYEHDNRKILYLAVENIFVAFFVVSYKPDDSLRPFLEKLAEEDLTIFVCNTDPSITQEILHKAFHLDTKHLTLFNRAQSEDNRKLMRKTLERAPASVLHSNTLLAFLKAIKMCKSLLQSIKRLRIFALIGWLTGILILLIAVFSGQLSLGNALVFTAFECLWCAVTLIATRSDG
jgi:hypothetical protein